MVQSTIPLRILLWGRVSRCYSITDDYEMSLDHSNARQHYYALYSVVIVVALQLLTPICSRCRCTTIFWLRFTRCCTYTVLLNPVATSLKYFSSSQSQHLGGWKRRTLLTQYLLYYYYLAICHPCCCYNNKWLGLFLTEKSVTIVIIFVEIQYR